MVTECWNDDGHDFTIEVDGNWFCGVCGQPEEVGA